MSGNVDRNDRQEAVKVDRSLSVQEAAARLELSERTIRRHIKDGSLQAYQRPTSRGYEWRILLDTEPVKVDANDRQAGVKVDSQARQEPVKVDTGEEELEAEPVQEAPAAELGLLKALELVDRLQRESTRLQGENKELYGRAAFFQAKLQAAEERILMLEAQPAEEEPAELEAEPEKPSGSWWRRLLRK